jgi:hypothetical protein
MAINQNHLAEELNGVKCAIVEKNVGMARAEFLKQILEFNQFHVLVVPSPAPKTPAPTAPTSPSTNQPSADAPPPPSPETFTVGVTDLMFNPINAIFGRLLKSPAGHVITLAYWQQRDRESHDEIPYFE